MSSPVQSAPPETERAPRRRLRYIVFGIFLLILLALIVPPSISMRRFQPRIAGALSKSLGRPVSIGEVSMRLLPAPALVLNRVAVDDDPAFSHEPMLRSDEVTAWLRLSSLWRGRLEIARLTFDSPSLNLVRRPDGHWNLESLLERARETPVAPTAKRTSGPRLRFPYIESDSGRVNLKLGMEKTVFSLTDADFALWLEREDEWHLRLTAQPIRTDANLGDTGTIQLSGTIRRGGSLSDTPLDLHFVLERGQLGQLSTLVYGRDRGWRGSMNVSAELKGTPSDVAVRASATVDDFDRYDIPETESVRLRTSCTASFHSTTQQLDDVRCTSPVGNGVVEARGWMKGIAPIQAYSMSAVARDVPAAAIASLVRHMKKDLPEDVSASGAMSAQVTVARDGAADPEWTGSGVLSRFSLSSGRMDGALGLGDVRFALAREADRVPRRKHAAEPPRATLLTVQPFAVNLGGDTPAQAQADFSRTGYRISVKGDTGLKRLLQVSEALGVATPRFSPDGEASVDLSIAGEWAGFAQPLVVGTAKLKGTVPVNGVGTPVQVTTANVNLQPSGVSVDHLVFGWPKAGVMLDGSMQLPRHCTTIETCPVSFRLHSDALSVASLNALLNPEAQKRPWYAFIESSAAKNPVLARVAASGTISVGRLEAGTISFSNLSGDAGLSRGQLSLTNITGEVWDGKLAANLRADFSASPAAYEASGRLDGAAVAAMSGKTSPSWGSGKLNGDFVLGATGISAAALEQSAGGKIGFDWRNGTAALSLDGGKAPLRVRQFRGTATLHDGKLQFAGGKMTTENGIYQVSGTAALDRHLALTLSRADTPMYEITGTLEKPKAAPASAAQARLNP
ncbi:MAG: AsmA family protein [Terriglobales bacterium]